MNILKLSELIGQEIVELRFHYVPENEYGLQSFHSYIKLGNGITVDIPKCDDNEYLQLTKENLDYFKNTFDTGQLVSEEVQSYFVGQKIIDFYFCYYNNEIDLDHASFIKLSNNYYLTENNFGPIGLTNIDLIILDQTQFTAELKRLNEVKIEVRSFVKTKNAY